MQANDLLTVKSYPGQGLGSEPGVHVCVNEKRTEESRSSMTENAPCASLMGRVKRSAKCGAFDLRDMHFEKRLPFKREPIGSGFTSTAPLQ